MNWTTKLKQSDNTKSTIIPSRLSYGRTTLDIWNNGITNRECIWNYCSLWKSYIKLYLQWKNICFQLYISPILFSRCTRKIGQTHVFSWLWSLYIHPFVVPSVCDIYQCNKWHWGDERSPAQHLLCAAALARDTITRVWRADWWKGGEEGCIGGGGNYYIDWLGQSGDFDSVTEHYSNLVWVGGKFGASEIWLTRVGGLGLILIWGNFWERMMYSAGKREEQEGGGVYSKWSK